MYLKGSWRGGLEVTLPRELARELGGNISNQGPLYYSSTQPKPSPTLLLLNFPSILHMGEQLVQMLVSVGPLIGLSIGSPSLVGQ